MSRKSREREREREKKRDEKRDEREGLAKAPPWRLHRHRFRRPAPHPRARGRSGVRAGPSRRVRHGLTLSLTLTLIRTQIRQGPSRRVRRGDRGLIRPGRPCRDALHCRLLHVPAQRDAPWRHHVQPRLTHAATGTARARTVRVRLLYVLGFVRRPLPRMPAANPQSVPRGLSLEELRTRACFFTGTS